MQLNTRYAGQSNASASANKLSFSLMTDLNRPGAFLNAKVKSGREFSRAMLILHQVVCSNLKAPEKDNSAYHAWLQSEFLKEISAGESQRNEAMVRLASAQAELNQAVISLNQEIADNPVSKEKEGYDAAVDRFYKWLWDVNHDAWIVIDPVVSVQPDVVYFEGFSLDESTYARVGLPQAELEHNEPTSRGTTNIDFSTRLARELHRVRSYRPLTLQVGLSGVTASTEIGTAMESKIDLPESWLKGFLQVQSAIGLPGKSLRLSASTLSDVISLLEQRKERTGPRSLRFHLVPGECPEIEVDPWGVRIKERRYAYDGDTPEIIRIWGRRRLCLLKDILVTAAFADVRLLGTGMPSFWSVKAGPISLDIGLSGWTANDWAKQARFHEMAAMGEVPTQVQARASALLKQATSLSPRELAGAMQIDQVLAAAALQRLCAAGKAMYDANVGGYRWRELFPPGVSIPEDDTEESKEWRAARILVEATPATLLTMDVAENGARSVSVALDQGRFKVSLELDEDGRMKRARCSCGTFRKHQLRKGACRHLLAAIIMANQPSEGLV